MGMSKLPMEIGQHYHILKKHRSNSMKQEIDVFSILVIIVDILSIAFLVWRATSKTATLWGAARFIYWWVAFTLLYHVFIYSYSLLILHPLEDIFIPYFLHNFVVLYVLNPILIAIIHYRGGHLL
jgi:hypothetical protein